MTLVGLVTDCNEMCRRRQVFCFVVNVRMSRLSRKCTAFARGFRIFSATVSQPVRGERMTSAYVSVCTYVRLICRADGLTERASRSDRDSSLRLVEQLDQMSHYD